ncbi:MAG: sensor histidine kinase KdpD [Acidobacteriia bacterium]|nr:sensor histidine kinase KdpD [Terriglobia bacterium]
MENDRRPDPEAILARIEADERSSSRGRLKIFFGAAAGVGKTFAMLQAAHERLAEGVDVVVGHVVTHGRAETEALLAGLPILPERQVTHRGHVLEEFDLDAALARKPKVLIVDELAHTNAPGSRHARRHQDVEELLRAGIDVYTTLNVQHIESLNDLVAQITGVTVRETVPDSVLETADDVALVDLPPDELLARLREGKVYIPEQAERAMANFFRKGNLIALREMSLRCTADRVDAQMQVYRKAEGSERTWPITEKILVCISPSPSAVRVVRAGRRLARRLRAEWTVLFVEQPRHVALGEADREYATQGLRLAEQLGAEAITISGHDATEEVLSFARARNFSRIVVGKPARFWWLRELFVGSFVERLARRSGDIDVFIVHGDAKEDDAARPAIPPPKPAVDWSGYAWAAGTVAACSVIAGVMARHFELSNLIMVYLLGVVISATRWGRGPSLLSALLGVAAFDFFFVPPFLTFAVSDYQYVVTFLVMAAVAVTISTLTVRFKEQAEVARQRERRTGALYSLSRELASTRSLDAMIAAIRRHVEEAFEGRTAVLLAGEDGRLATRDAAAHPFVQDPKETAVAQWVHEHAEAAGRGTSTLAGAEALYLPLVGSRGPVGVLALRPEPDRRPLNTDQMHLLETFANQAALALERALLAREAHRSRLAAEGENLRNALLAAVSHDLRTPLAAISGAASSLAFSEDRLPPPARRELVLTIHEEAERMTRLANNLLDMGRLQSRSVALRREWQPLEEVFGAALQELDLQLRDREVVLRLPADLPQVPIDEVLIERVLVNLLENAARYTPPGTPIELAAAAGQGEVRIDVLDRGPGLLPGEESRIFEKFVRGETAPSRRGIGLGLAVARSIVEAHGGRIWAENRPDGGAAFRFTLPLKGEPPESPSEPPEPEPGP